MIAVAGASGSGKTTLVTALAQELGACVLRTDDYYRPLDHLTYDERCNVNFDDPAAIDGGLLVKHLRELSAGNPVEAPSYDFTRHTRFPKGHPVPSRPYIIVEGLFALCFPQILRLASLAVFVDAADGTCLDRRIERDVNERGRTPGEVVGRFYGHVLPMYQKHVLPTRSRATVMVSGERPLAEGLGKVLSALSVHA